jgi:hypothetical protein
MITEVTYQRKYTLANNEHLYLSVKSISTEDSPSTGDELMNEARNCVVNNMKKWQAQIKQISANKPASTLQGMLTGNNAPRK